MPIRLPRKQLLASGLLLILPALAQADSALVAVAANFAEPIKAIAAELKKTTGHTLSLSTGASGAFYTQIKNGAPYDLFLSADSERPKLLEKAGLTQPGSRFTYATGKLVLWSATAGKVDDQGKVLHSPALGKVAFANPKTAPYGAAAVQVMQRTGVAEALKNKLVQGESIGQTFNFVKTGNAEAGFVAMSQVLQDGKLKAGSMWVIPQTAYDAIRQDAVVLQRGANNKAVAALVKLMRSPHIQQLIRSYGYAL